MSQARKEPTRPAAMAPSPSSKGRLPLGTSHLPSATRLRQAAEKASVGTDGIARSLMSTLHDQGETEPRLPPSLSFASLLPQLTRTTSLQPLADKLEPEERRDVYRVAGKVGAGFTATVYEAVKEGADGSRTRVALKRIRDRLAEDDRFIELLADEARLATLIEHPNVCRVFDFGVDSSGYFMALEYLDGFTLQEVFAVLESQPERTKGPRHQRVIARIIADLAEGLHAAHELTDEKGESLEVVHQDVSPHNLFVLRSGEAKVTDFGVARARLQAHPPAAGVQKATMGYSSPEQLHRSHLDRQTDIFALGIVMWELLAAHRLFSADSDSAIIVKICSDPVPDVRRFQPEVSASLAAIVQKALAVDPTQRFATARGMASAIERALASQRDPISPEEVSEWLCELMGVRRLDVAPPTARSRHTLDMPLTSAAVGTAPSPSTSRSLAVTTGAALTLAVLCGSAWLLLKRTPPAAETTALVSPASPAVPVVSPVAPVAATPVAAPAASAANPSVVPREPVEAPVRPVEPATAPALKPRAAPDESEAAPLHRFGSVLVTATGGAADVLVDGRNFGPAPQRVTLPVGVHTVALSMAGRGTSAATPVQIDAGTSSFVTLSVPSARD